MRESTPTCEFCRTKPAVTTYWAKTLGHRSLTEAESVRCGYFMHVCGETRCKSDISREAWGFYRAWAKEVA